MVSPIRPNIAVAKPLAKAGSERLATPGGVAPLTSTRQPTQQGNETVSIERQKQIIRESDFDRSGTSSRAEITKYLIEQNPLPPSGDASLVFERNAKVRAEVDALFSNLDVDHGAYKGKDDLLMEEDATFLNTPISFTYESSSGGPT